MVSITQFVEMSLAMPNASEHPHFEVVRIRKQKEITTPNGIHYENKECYPSSESWGTEGFTCLTKQHAFDRLEKLKQKAQLLEVKEKIK